MDCIFCKIIKGEIPSETVYQDDKNIAILDINPVKPGHTLVLAKQHVPNFTEAPTEVIDNLLNVCQKVGGLVMKATDSEGYNLSVNNGRAAGQVIDHLHFHIVPRHTGDGLKLWPQQKYKDGEMAEVAEKIRQALS